MKKENTQNITGHSVVSRTKLFLLFVPTLIFSFSCSLQSYDAQHLKIVQAHSNPGYVTGRMKRLGNNIARGVWLAEARVSKDFSHYDLSEADLRVAQLEGCDLSFCNLEGAQLCGADLKKANLKDANLTGANLAGADLREADLSDANLTKANFCGKWKTWLHNVTAKRAKFTYANLRYAQLEKVDFEGANLYDADLSYAYLAGGNFKNAKLEDANLKKANLERAKFNDANLKRAKLFGAKLDNAIFENANMTGAKLGRSYWKCSATPYFKNITTSCLNTNFQHADLSLAEFGGVHFKKTNFSNADLSNIKASHCTFSWNKMVGVYGTTSKGEEILLYEEKVRRSCMSETHFESCIFDGAILKRGKFNHTCFESCTFKGATLEDGFFSHTSFNRKITHFFSKDTHDNESDLQGANLIDTRLYASSLAKNVKSIQNAVFENDLPGAIQEGNEIKVKILLKRSKFAVNKTDEEGESLAYNALKAGYENVVLTFLEFDAELPKVGKDGHTPLYWARYHNMETLIPMLLERGYSLEEIPEIEEDRVKSSPPQMSNFTLLDNSGVADDTIEMDYSLLLDIPSPYESDLEEPEIQAPLELKTKPSTNTHHFSNTTSFTSEKKIPADTEIGSSPLYEPKVSVASQTLLPTHSEEMIKHFKKNIPTTSPSTSTSTTTTTTSTTSPAMPSFSPELKPMFDYEQRTQTHASQKIPAQTISNNLPQKVQNLLDGLTEEERVAFENAGSFEENEETTMLFKDFVGMEKAIKEIRGMIDRFQRDVQERNLSYKAIILEGVSGVGKTSLAHAIANEYQYPVFKIMAEDLVQKGKDGVEKLKNIFKKARALQPEPSIIIIDEVDRICRQSIIDKEDRMGFVTTREILASIIHQELMSLRNNHDPVVVISTTNETKDRNWYSGVKDRLGGSINTIRIEPLELEDREKLFCMFMRKEAYKHALEIDDSYYNNPDLLADFAERTPFYSGREIKNIVKKILENIKSIEKESIDFSVIERMVLEYI